MNSLLTRIADQTRQALRADACLLLLLEGDDLVFQAWAGVEEALTGAGRLKVNESLTGAVIREGRPLVCPDLAGDPAWRETPLVRQFGYRAMLAAPMSLEDRTIGVLKILHREPRPFPPGEVGLLGILANQAALTIENARLLEETDRRLKQTDTLLAVSEAIGSTLDLTEIIRRAIREMVRALGADMGGAWRLDPRGGRFLPLAGYHVPKELVETYSRTPALFGDRLIDAVRALRGPIYSSDSQADPMFDHPLARLLPHKSVLIFPVGAKGDTIGGIALVWVREARRLTPEGLRLVEGVARQAAVAIENARLLEEAERRRRAAEELARVGRMLTESLDVSTVGERIAESVLGLFSAHSSSLRLLRPDGSQETVAWAGGRREHFAAGHVWPPGMGVAGRAMAEGRAMWSRDVLRDPGVVLTEDLRRRIAAAGDPVALAAPLRVKGEVIGTITVSDRAGRVFDDEEIRLVQAFADQAAIAVGNAQLYARERAARAEAEASTQRQAIQFAVTRILAGAATFREGTSKLLQTICEGMGWNLGEMWLVDLDASLLRWYGSWHGALVEAEEWEGISRGISFPPGRGLPGRVWASGEPTWVSDVVGDPEFLRAAVAASAGLHAAFAFPIRSGSDVVGVMVFFSREVRQPDHALLSVVADLGSQIGQFAERKWTEEALRLSEEQFRQSQKMEAIGRLAGGVAHDFNNLLTIIKGRSALLLRRLNPADPLRRDLDLIQKTAERAAQLTRQLLAFGRKQVLQPKVLDLNAVVAEMGTMLRRLIGEDIALVTVPGPGLGRVRADPGQIEQVLVNLAVNARDAMPEGGQLTIETANVEMDEAAVRRHVGAQPGSYVLLRVSDTGCGMNAETRARLFEPFFTTKEPGKGTGLGLATVYGIVKQSEGYIWVESAPGQGARFTIYLPRVEAPLEPLASAEKELAGMPRGSETVLLVEDEEGIRDLTREVLQAAGYTVLEARHGGQALLIAEQYAGAIHLLLTDVVMPHMSGRDLAERLAPLRPEIQVLYMSGYTDDAIVHHGVLEPGTAFLPKPFTPEALARRVREVLDEREPTRPDAT